MAAYHIFFLLFDCHNCGYTPFSDTPTSPMMLFSHVCVSHCFIFRKLPWIWMRMMTTLTKTSIKSIYHVKSNTCWKFTLKAYPCLNPGHSAKRLKSIMWASSSQVLHCPIHHQPIHRAPRVVVLHVLHAIHQTLRRQQGGHRHATQLVQGQLGMADACWEPLGNLGKERETHWKRDH